MTHFRQLSEETRISTEGERQHLVQSLIRQQSLLVRLMEKNIMAQLFELDLTLSQLKVLFLLNTHTWLKTVKLAQAVKRNPASVEEIVDKLVDRHLAARGLDSIVAITAQGRAVCDEISRSGNANLVSLLEKLNFHELNVLMQASDIIVKAALGNSGNPDYF